MQTSCSKLLRPSAIEHQFLSAFGLVIPDEASEADCHTSLQTFCRLDIATYSTGSGANAKCGVGAYIDAARNNGPKLRLSSFFQNSDGMPTHWLQAQALVFGLCRALKHGCTAVRIAVPRTCPAGPHIFAGKACSAVPMPWFWRAGLVLTICAI